MRWTHRFWSDVFNSQTSRINLRKVKKQLPHYHHLRKALSAPVELLSDQHIRLVVLVLLGGFRCECGAV